MRTTECHVHKVSTSTSIKCSPYCCQYEFSQKLTCVKKTKEGTNHENTNPKAKSEMLFHEMN